MAYQIKVFGINPTNPKQNTERTYCVSFNWGSEDIKMFAERKKMDLEKTHPICSYTIREHPETVLDPYKPFKG